MHDDRHLGWFLLGNIGSINMIIHLTVDSNDLNKFLVLLIVRWINFNEHDRRPCLNSYNHIYIAEGFDSLWHSASHHLGL